MRARLPMVEFLVAVAMALLMLACSPVVSWAQVPDAARSFKREYTAIARSEWGLLAPVSSLAAQIHQESGWNCRAMSPVGARGCAQFMPATAKWIGDVDHRLAGGDVYSPAWGFRAQAVYMKWLHDRVKADTPCERMAFALAAYNGGLGYVYRRQKVSNAPGRCFQSTCDINPGIAPASQKENAAYPRRILLGLEPRYMNAGWGEGVCA
jgi:soluble lytic murein transglycosylase-like protein